MKLAPDLDRIAAAAAQRHGLDVNLVRAISIVESVGNPWRVRYEEKFQYLYRCELFARQLGISTATEETLQRISWGPMQIMGSVAREDGYTDHLTKLVDPAVAYEWSCLQLKQLLRRYGETDAIAAWNAGSPRTRAGAYVNQVYVNKVTGVLELLRRNAV